MPQGPGLLATFLYYFSSTVIIIVFVVSQGMHLSWNAKQPYQLGILVGLIAGLVGAIRNRSLTLSTVFQNRKAFIKTLDETLAQMGFSQKLQLENYWVYKKSSLQTLFSGKVFVQIEHNQATIVGRAS